MNERVFRILTATIAVIGGVAVWVIATELFPYHSVNHDEAVYLQQAAMLLEGDLSLRPPVDGVARPWFFIESGDRLYPKYAPVPAAVFAFGQLVGGYRLALVGTAVGNLTLIAGVISEVFDRRTGCLGAVFVLCSPLFLITSSVFLPYAPTTLLNLTFAYSYLRADRTGSRRWAAVAGVAIGLAFFSRPFTAVVFAAPFVGHALWTLTQHRESIARHAWTATLGLIGVGIALAYNTTVTGTPWSFPYEVFAPQDGLGFGHRRILDHELKYTPELALSANSKVLEQFGQVWFAGGLLGMTLAVGGMGLSLYRRRAREALLVGLFVSIVAGNVYFWGNVNILGTIDHPDDGLIAFLGPYYHFDLLVPTAAFAATAVWSAIERVQAMDLTVASRVVGVFLAVGVVVSASGIAAVTAINVDERIDRNQAVTDTYTAAYEPFEDGPPPNSLVLLPTPHGNWLNHPFQPLRNDPGFDGKTVYTTDAHPFDSVEAFPNRSVYRYVYRGSWAPASASPETARLQRVHEVTDKQVRLHTTFGIPPSATGATVRVTTDSDSAYHTVTPDSDALTVALAITDDGVTLDNATQTGPIAVAGRDTVRLTVFVEHGAGDGFTYRLDLPVDVSPGSVRALSPRVEQCYDVRNCGGQAAYIPDTAPSNVSIHTTFKPNNSSNR